MTRWTVRGREQALRVALFLAQPMSDTFESANVACASRTYCVTSQLDGELVRG